MNIVELMVAILAVAIVFDAIMYFMITKVLKKKLRFEIERNKKKTWTNVEVDNAVHTMPVNDKFIHFADEDCGCAPRVEPVPREDGTVGWLYIHDAADGRD